MMETVDIEKHRAALGYFARNRSKGEAAPAGGGATVGMKKRLYAREAKLLADDLSADMHAARHRSTERANRHVRERGLQDERAVGEGRMDDDLGVRDPFGRRGFEPEELPFEGGMRKLRRRTASDERALEKSSRGVPVRESLLSIGIYWST